MNDLSTWLPVELWSKVIRKLASINIKEVARLRLLSTFHNQLIVDDKVLNYKILLLFHREDAPGSLSDQLYWICRGRYSGHFKTLSEARLDVIKWFIKKYNLMPDKIRKPPKVISINRVILDSTLNRSLYYLLLNRICCSSRFLNSPIMPDKTRLDIIKWIIDELNMSIDEIRQSQLIYEACEQGQVHIIEYLDEKFKLEREDFLSKKFRGLMCLSSVFKEPSPFTYTYRNAQFKVLRWAIDRFHLGD